MSWKHAGKMMKCGHAANAEDGRGNPVCAICIGIVKGANEVVEQPNLDGRKAVCSYCGKEVQSETKLAFFEHLPAEKFDGYYCGCRGWD